MVTSSQLTGEHFSSKFLDRPHTRGDLLLSPLDEKVKKFPHAAYLTGGDGTPILGFGFQGRKSFRLAAAPVGGPRPAVAAWWTPGPGRMERAEQPKKV